MAIRTQTQETIESIEPDPNLYDRPCLNLINQYAAAEPGIVGVNLDIDQQRVSFDYDPALVNESALQQIAQQISPPLRTNLQKCTLRLGARGGRLCESCALALEGKVGGISGVQQASASYLGGVLSVTYDSTQTSPVQLLQNIKQFGIDVGPSNAELTPAVELSETPLSPLQKARTWLAGQSVEAIFTAITFVAMMTGWLAAYLGAPAIVSTVSYVTAYITGGAFGLKGGLESLRDGTIDIDLLMILAALGAAVVGAPFEGAMLLFLFSLSNVLQDYALNRTRNAIKALMKLRPDQALIRRGSRLVTMPIAKVVVGDRFMVRPGDRIPLDGIVVEGQSTVDQASITGESLPVNKSPGDPVLAGTINQNGNLEARVVKSAEDSTIAKMIRLVEEAQSKKAPTQRFLDKAEQYYAMGVIGFTFLAISIPILWA
jgi:Cd2+/Zn2+-exporting ATPase